MRRFLAHIVLFLIAFLPCYLVGLLLVGGLPLRSNITYVPANYGHLRSRLAEADTIGKVDVLFLGSSHCYRTFDPRIFASEGIRVFNMGSSNQSLIQTYTLLGVYLPRLRPDLVVLEVHPDIMALDGVESACDLLSNMPFSLSLLQRNIRVVNTAVYSLMRRDNRLEDSIISVATQVNGQQVVCPFAYVTGGFVELPCLRYLPQSHALRTIQMNPKQLCALDQCISLLHAFGTEVFLLEVPATETLYHSYVNHADFEAEMAARGRYVNLNGRLPLVDSLHFFDDDHLNQEGVEMVCKYMIQCML